MQVIYPINGLLVESKILIGDVAIMPPGRGTSGLKKAISELAARHDIGEKAKDTLVNFYKNELQNDSNG